METTVAKLSQCHARKSPNSQLIRLHQKHGNQRGL